MTTHHCCLSAQDGLFKYVSQCSYLDYLQIKYNSHSCVMGAVIFNYFQISIEFLFPQSNK